MKWALFGREGHSARVIANGLALDYPKFSGGRYTEYAVVGAAARMKLPGYCQQNLIVCCNDPLNPSPLFLGGITHLRVARAELCWISVAKI